VFFLGVIVVWRLFASIFLIWALMGFWTSLYGALDFLYGALDTLKLVVVVTWTTYELCFFLPN
jgi:hypothetical protein